MRIYPNQNEICLNELHSVIVPVWPPAADLLGIILYFNGNDS